MKLIVARDKNGGIGINNTLPWPHIEEDMKWFQQCTKGRCVVMGRLTFESLGSIPLPSRHSIVITSEPNKYVPSDSLEFMTLNEFVKSPYIHSAWLIGGATLYKTLLPYVTEAYVTEVDGEYECDSFFNWDFSEGFSKVVSSEITDGVTVDTYWRN